MPKFGALLNSLSGKAGIKADDETLKKLLAFVEVSQFDLPDEFANALERNLLTQESATANPDVRSKIMAEALNGVDSRIETMLGDFEFDDSFKGEVKGIKNSYEKLNKVASGLKEQLKAAKEKANKSGATQQDKQEVDVLKREIEKANQQMADLKRSHEIELENERTKSLNDKIDYLERSKLASKRLPQNGLDLDINIQSAQLLLKREAAKHGLKVVFDDAGNPVLKQRKDGVDVDYFVDNKKIIYDSFIDGVLASNKFVQINDPNPTPIPGQGNNGLQPQPGVLSNPTLAAEASAKLAQLGIGTQV